MRKTAQYYHSHPEALKRKRTYDDAYEKRPEQVRARTSRNKAARRLGRKPGYDVDHIIPLSKGGTNSRRNLRLVRASTNRAKGNRAK